MDAVQRFQLMLVLMQVAAFVLGMIFERRLEAIRKQNESQD